MKGGAEPLTAEVVEAMTTNETFFFRDKIPFDHLRRDGPAGAGAGARGAPFPAHLVRSFLHRAGTVFDRDVPEGSRSPVLRAGGSRSSRPTFPQEVLEKSKAGIYQPVRGAARLADPDAGQIFHAESAKSGSSMSEIRSMVQHRQLNLLQDFSHLGMFDVIFCRNVLIYFDQDTKANIFQRISRMLEPDGVLALGAAESVVGITNAFKPVPERRGLYRTNTAPAALPGCHDPGAANAGRRSLRRADPHSLVYRIACGTNRDVLPVIGFSSSRIDSPHGV